MEFPGLCGLCGLCGPASQAARQAVRAWVEPVPCLTVMSQGKGLLDGAGAGTGAGITHNHNQPTLHSTAYMENIENLNYLDVIER